VLSSYIKAPNRTLYNFKRDCIQNSLYGVDIDPSAVEIAKLRLWLSLVVDEDDIKQIKPLPNLDYKIMQGNSLLEEFEGVKLFDEKLIAGPDMGKEQQIEKTKSELSKLQKEYIDLHSQGKLTSSKKQELDLEFKKLNGYLSRLTKPQKSNEGESELFDTPSKAKEKAKELKSLHKEFFEASQKSRKEQIKKRIETLEWELIEETLKEQGTRESLKKLEQYKRANAKPFFLWKLNFAEVFEEKGGFDVVIANPPYGANIDDLVETYRSVYPEVIKNYADIYKIFFDLGLRVCKSSGIETYITPNTYLAQPRYRDLRNFLLRFKIDQIINLGEEVFEGVIVPVCITLIENSPPKSSYLFADASVGGKYGGDVSNIHFQSVQLEDVRRTPDVSLLQLFSLKPDEVILDMILEIKDAGIQYHRSGIGLKNKGGNDLYERIFNGHSKSDSKPIWYGKLVDRYFITDKTDEYFDINYKKVLRANESVSFSREAFEQSEKILWRQTASSVIAVLDTQERWFRNTLQCAYLRKENSKQVDLKYVLAHLNSNYFRWLYHKIVNEAAGRVFPQVKITHVKKLPLKLIDPKAQQPFIDVVDTILHITKSKDYSNDLKKKTEVRNHMKRLDKMIYKLYELTPTEIQTIENFADQ